MGSRRIEFLSAAEADLHGAAAWYAERDRRVARGFLMEVRRVSALIAQQPGVGSRWIELDVERVVRRFPLRRFPYVVMYVEDEIVLVVAVAHVRQNPRELLARLDGDNRAL